VRPASDAAFRGCWRGLRPSEPYCGTRGVQNAIPSQAPCGRPAPAPPHWSKRHAHRRPQALTRVHEPGTAASRAQLRSAASVARREKRQGRGTTRGSPVDSSHHNLKTAKRNSAPAQTRSLILIAARQPALITALNRRWAGASRLPLSTAWSWWASSSSRKTVNSAARPGSRSASSAICSA
jgi:hypothetical protein